MHSTRCFPPTSALQTVLLPSRGQQTVYTNTGALTDVGIAFPRSQALIVTGLFGIVRLWYAFASSGDAEVQTVVLGLGSMRIIPAHDVVKVEFVSDAQAWFWVEEIQTADPHEYGPR